MQNAMYRRGLTLLSLSVALTCATGCAKKRKSAEADEDESGSGSTSGSEKARKKGKQAPEYHARHFVHLLARGEFEHAAYRLDVKMKQVFSREKLKQLWEGVIANMGGFNEIVGARTEKKGELAAVTLSVRFARGKVNVRIVLDDEGKLAGLFFAPAQPQFPYKTPPYAKRGSFTEEEIKVRSGNWVLPGTLTLPKTANLEHEGELAAEKEKGKGKGKGKGGTGKDGAGKDGAGKDGAGKDGAEKGGAGKDGAWKGGTGKGGTGKDGTGKDAAGKDAAGKGRTGELEAAKGGTGKSGAPKGGTGKGAPGKGGPARNRGGQRVPGVVLVHGSGPHDRDHTVRASKPFKDLAWGLAARGIGVFRYDKRTKVHRDRLRQMAMTLTVKDEVVDDALAAVARLRRDSRIDPSRIVVAGYGFGGYLLPRIAKRDKGLAGLVIMAGNTRRLEVLIVEQLEYLVSLGGAAAETARRKMTRTKAAAARIRGPGLRADTDPNLLAGAPASYWLDLRRYDPVATARTIARPMLILHGDRDYETTLKDFDGWQKGLKGRRSVTFKRYPSLNHLFVFGQGKSGPEEYETPGHVARVVIEDIAGFVKGLRR